MKVSTTFLTRALLVSTIATLYLFSCTPEKPTDTSTYDEVLMAEVSTACECEASWFPHSQTPAPQEGKGSPFDTTSTTNCMFHQWSWQKFLYLTKPQSDGKPLFLEEFIEVDAKMEVTQPQQGEALVLSSTGQAGGGGILKTNPHFSTNQSAATVYYSIHMNTTMYEAATAFRTAILNGSLPANNKETFPIGSVELKVSWVDADALDPSVADAYYTTTAAVQQADNSYRVETVALLGMHVVGVVINHPEFIWATFEHHDMAPDFDWNTSEASSATETLLFGTGSTNTLEGIQWDGSNKVPKLPNNAYTLFEFGIPRTSNNAFVNTSQAEPANYNNIISIDSCVAANLQDVWNNYYYKGSLWLNMDGLTPTQQADTIVALANNIGNVAPGAIPRGSTANANLTMETFEQTFAPDISETNVISNISNCFSCHGGVGFASDKPKSPIYLSHVFDGYLQAGKGKTMQQINELKFVQYREMRSGLAKQ
ncbi:hypothetical protein [Lewinella sp. LCG006]|uniref:hypothetical protein n=1 Tax=Lewinella sp. LCG006 TaxID=3231911 RepID=UPI00346128EE